MGRVSASLSNSNRFHIKHSQQSFEAITIPPQSTACNNQTQSRLPHRTILTQATDQPTETLAMNSAPPQYSATSLPTYEQLVQMYGQPEQQQAPQTQAQAQAQAVPRLMKTSRPRPLSAISTSSTSSIRSIRMRAANKLSNLAVMELSPPDDLSSNYYNSPHW